MADHGPILGTTSFSLTPLWRAGADPVEVLEHLASTGCGPALEVIGHQIWRGFPALSAADERAFRAAVDRLGLVPVALGVYADLYRRPGRTMTAEEAFEALRAQLAVAARLGFGVVRAALGMEPVLMRRVLAEAERLGVVLTFELQGMTAPDAPAVVDVLTLQAQTGSPYLGFTIDFSLSTPDLPAAFDLALRRSGLAEDRIGVIHESWESRRMGAALAALAGHRDEAVLANLVAGVVGRCGRSQPADWAAVLPLARHAHAKFWDPDVESVRASHGAWLSV
ncbi:hypothetical protein AB0M20_29750, partial [Actinoplanes sp. NPDC051633]|uniref:sugar phosphate isomerase/epimerase family protein n=1 Tax=Actinoplanes sp. NPDC051633 TaxID=3155670 RepID=UPI003444B68C